MSVFTIDLGWALNVANANLSMNRVDVWQTECMININSSQSDVDCFEGIAPLSALVEATGAVPSK